MFQTERDESLDDVSADLGLIAHFLHQHATASPIDRFWVLTAMIEVHLPHGRIDVDDLVAGVASPDWLVIAAADQLGDRLAFAPPHRRWYLRFSARRNAAGERIGQYATALSQPLIKPFCAEVVRNLRCSVAAVENRFIQLL
ncbi:MAG: hypothetical protein AAF961_16575 [Planctomycetota bacterium]